MIEYQIELNQLSIGYKNLLNSIYPIDTIIVIHDDYNPNDFCFTWEKLQHKSINMYRRIK